MAAGKKTGGRTAGTPNKLTAEAKAAFQLAFEGAGGVDALTQWAIQNPNLFYPLFSKLIPHDVTTGGEKIRSFVIELPPEPDGETQP